MAGSGVLKILIVGADSLDKIVTAGQQQPYYILECGNQRSRSKPCLDSGIHPTWNTAHKFNIADEVQVLAVIKDEVTKGIIGQGVIELPRAKQYGKDEGAAVLMNLGGNPAGTLRFKLKFQSIPGTAAAAAAPPPAAATTAAAAARGQPDTGNHASAGQYVLPPQAAAAGAPQLETVNDDDPMLAAVTSKVSLAKQAMQQLTAELAELTGADGGAGIADTSSSPFDGRQPPPYSTSFQDRQNKGAAGAVGTLQQQFRSFRQPRVSTGSLSPGAVSPSLSPHGWPDPSQQQASSELAGWHASWRSGAGLASPGELSTEDLLLLYGGEQAAEVQRTGSSAALVRQLQQALASAHADKVATVDELSNVKQAMADLSKQHFLDVKRLRDAAGPAAAGLAPPQSSPESAPGIRRMVDTHPPRAHGRGPRTSESSDGLGGVENDRRDDQPGKGAAAAAAAASPGAAGEDALSPVPVYKLQIQIRQLERQLADQAAKTQEEVTKREAVAAQVETLQAKLDAQAAATKTAEANAKAAEEKAAQQATVAAAARAEAAAALANSSGKDAVLATELTQLRAEVSELRNELSAALTEKGELEEALGLMEKNSSAQVAELQAELHKAREELASLREGGADVASLQEQLAAARAEASGLRNSNEDVDYLQTQLRRTLRDNVELRHQVQMIQANMRHDDAGADTEQAEEHAAMFSEQEALMLELVNTKLELAELKEQQVRMQRQLYKAQEGLKGNQI